MSQLIKSVRIRNFKSVKSIDLIGCKRINILIGRPNVGKTNIIEALSLFSLPFMEGNCSKKITNFIRFENEPELFYDGNFETPIIVAVGEAKASIVSKLSGGLTLDIESSAGRQRYQVDKNHILRRGSREIIHPFVRRYSFISSSSFNNISSTYLISPNGPNLFSVIETNTNLKHQIETILAESGLRLVNDEKTSSLKIATAQKNACFPIPFTSLASRLQRLIFFTAAIATNTNAVLLLEDPELHSFFTKRTGIMEIIFNHNNQLFLITHNPGLLKTFVENHRDEVAVFNIMFKEEQTMVKRFTQKELVDIVHNGVDVFTNNEAFC